MSFMLQLRLTLTGGAGLALQTSGDISRNTKEVTTPENPLFVGRAGCPLWVNSGHPLNVRFAAIADVWARRASTYPSSPIYLTQKPGSTPIIYALFAV
jgi:hypothetical protein